MAASHMQSQPNGDSIASPLEARMAKKSMISEATDAVKSVAGAALGAAAVAVTGVVVARVAGAITDSGQQLEKSAPQIQKLAEDTVTKPQLPSARLRPRRSAWPQRRR